MKRPHSLIIQQFFRFLNSSAVAEGVRNDPHEINKARKVDNQKTVLIFLDKLPTVVHKKRFI